MVDKRSHNKRNTHYALTAEEAIQLRNDSRVEAVELKPSDRDDIEIKHHGQKSGTTDFGNFIDINYETDIQWGLFSSHSTLPTNRVFTSTAKENKSYEYTLTGEGVDVVIQDSGITPAHPEFHDQNGVSRVQQINWYTASGISGSQDPNFYADTYGHGTHVAGIVAGKYQGWAPNAHIYSVKVAGLEGYTGAGVGLPVEDSFDVITQWHLRKPLQSNGYRRPTIVNMSWGYMSTYINSLYGEHQGIPWDDSNNPSTYRLEYGMVNQAMSFFEYRHPIHVASVDADVQQMIEAGIIICSSAGNDFHRSYKPGQLGYDNWYSGEYWQRKYQEGEISDPKRYYHRGSSPTFNDGVISVGNIEPLDQGNSTIAMVKNDSSTTGPGVDIWAPGTQILSSIETQRNNENSTRYGVYDLAKYTGTSMASPQVAGYLATVCEMRPWLKPHQALGVVETTAVTDQIEGYQGEEFNGGTEATETNYTNYRSGQGSKNRILNTPFKSGTKLTARVNMSGTNLR